MANVLDPDESPDDPTPPVKPSRPKRGAFPTPQSEIDNATPYIPDTGEEEDSPAGDPDQPTSIEGENEG